jgi:ketosteroid isomerase-like protein
VKRLLVIAGLAIAASSFVSGQTKGGQAGQKENPEQELRERLREWDEASSRRDTEALNRILADDFLFTNASGAVITKTQYLMATIKAPDMTLATSVGSEDVKVRVYGETAVVTSRGAQRGQPLNRDPAVRYRYTDVWVKQQGRWNAVASQATLILGP